MADKPTTISRRFMRKDLEKFLPTPRLIKEFDALSADVTTTLPDAIASIGTDTDTILAAGSFQQRPPQQPPVTEDATSRILAGQIFGA